MKRIVICCDGTWNSPDQTDQGVPCPTNVAKLAQAIRPVDATGVQQLMYYDPGVGTSGTALRRTFEGATGAGLSRNIRQAYRYLIDNYASGDELYLFGFSRGAYTVRSLAGLIGNCGLLRPGAKAMIDHAYALYRSRAAGSRPREKEAVLFRRTYAVADVTPIKFMGVWDTVGALGNPLLLNGLISRRYCFHDTRLGAAVQYAYQALAIDEQRRHFKATLWHQPPHAEGQTLEQMWFVGVHSNVGGGYPSTGLSDIALEWMVAKARACELDVERIPKRGDRLECPEQSRAGLYRVLDRYHRPIAAADPAAGPTNEALHASVLARYAQDPTYRPQNLEDYFNRFPALRPDTPHIAEPEPVGG